MCRVGFLLRKEPTLQEAAVALDKQSSACLANTVILFLKLASWFVNPVC